MDADAKKMTAESNDQWTIRRIIDWTTGHLEKHGSDTPRLDAEILLAHARGCQRIDLYTRPNELLSDAERARMRNLVLRRAKAEPVAYLVGHREFFSLDFQVTPDVLIPRPETETLVVELLELVKPLPQPRILEIGTGSGCIAVATAVNCRIAAVTAVDICERALAVARSNAEQHSVSDRIHFLEGDLFSPLEASGRFDIIVSNPPYVAETELDTLQADVRLHEPRGALVAGSDGLTIIRRLIETAPQHLAENGHLLIEISPEQVDDVKQMFDSQNGYTDIKVMKDLSGKARLVQARSLLGSTP